jgi:Mrp family chromosome partitioning ATPase
MPTEAQILSKLSTVQDPELHRSLTDLKMVREVQVKDGIVDITIALTVPNCPLKDQIEKDIQTAVNSLGDVNQVNVSMTAMTDEERKQVFGEQIEGSAAKYNRISKVVAVMSGKGGVGKSFVTSLLASALAKEGHTVGILDADITGPSIPKLFGVRPPVEAGPVGIRPLTSQTGVKIISINLLLENDDQPVVWRGPLIGRAITQLWGDVMWGDLDYLLVDLPPGTSDAALTTLQSLPVNGAIMVTTPQSLAAMIVRKAVHMTHMVQGSILGVVENMAYFVCPDTGNRHYIFGPSHAVEVMVSANAPLLAQIPIDPNVASLCDSGQVEKVELAETRGLLESFITAMPVIVRDKRTEKEIPA